MSVRLAFVSQYVIQWDDDGITQVIMQIDH